MTRMLAALIIYSLATPLVAEWHQFGGPHRDFALNEAPPIVDWGAAGPKVAWTRDLGPGYAGLITNAGGTRLFTQTRDGADELVVALDVATGKTKWMHRYEAPVSDLRGVDMSYGDAPQATPLLADGQLFTLGFTGKVRALDASTGALAWAADLGPDYTAPMPYFGHAASPLRVDDPSYPEGHAVVIAAGGALAFDPASGDLLWENRSFGASYASPILVETAFGRQIIVAGAGDIVGLDPVTGALLWRHPFANPQQTTLGTPILVDDDLLFVSVYFRGSRGLRLTARDRVEQVWEQPDFQVSHFNAVRRGSTIFTTYRKSLIALNGRTGEIMWKKRRHGAANLLSIGDETLVLGDGGLLSVARLDGAQVQTRQTACILDERSWTPPTVVGDRVFVRDQRIVRALDLGTAGNPTRSGGGNTTSVAGGVALVPEDFRAAVVAIETAALGGDAEAIAAAASRFAAWETHPDLGTWSAYHRAFGHWQVSYQGEPTAQLTAVDLAIEAAKHAVELDRKNAEAHALLGTLYPRYYQLAPRRAAVVGALGDEHLSRALALDPDNPRVRAISALDLAYSPAMWGGDPEQGRALLADVVAGFATGTGANEGAGAASPQPGAEPTWGPAMTRFWLARLLLTQEPKDATRGARLLDEALMIAPSFAAARALRGRVDGGAHDKGSSTASSRFR